MPTTAGQWFFLLAALLVGVFIGALVSWLFSNKENEAPPNAELEALHELRRQYQERVGLWVERASGKLVVRMGNHMAGSPQELSEPQQKQLQTLMREWLSWMGFANSMPAAPAPAPAAGPAPEPAAPPTPPPAVLVTPPPAEPVLPKPAGNAPLVAVPDLQISLAPKPAAEPPKPKSIVEQINDILQEKLLTHPLRVKGIRLVEDPKMGVVVWVGIEHFNGVDGVVDPEVKALLKAAVAEWEQRSAQK